MSIDVDKLRDKAQKLLSKRKTQQALKLYESSLTKDPHYPDLWCELASLQKSVGDADSSGSSYFRAAEMYVKAGQDRYALAACQKAVKSGADPKNDDIEGARRLLKVLAAKIKEGKKATPSRPGAGGAAKSLLQAAASSGRVRLGESHPVENGDYDEIDATPLPPPLSALIPIQRRQASDFQREPTNELDLEEYASSGDKVPFNADKKLVAAAPPPPPVSYWDELKEGKKKPKPRPKPRPRVARPKPGMVAPAERFMVLSRRDAGTLLAGLRSGNSYGIPEKDLAEIEADAKTPEDRVFRVLQRSLLFEGLSREQLLTHASPDRLAKFQKGEVIAATGQGSDRLFSILNGEVKAYTPNGDREELALLRPGAIIGEQSFVGTVGMKTRVEADSEVETIALDRSQAEELLTDHPASLYAMLRVVEERVVSNMLQRAGFFRLFEVKERDLICPRFEILEVADDEVIVAQGSPSKTLCLLMSGTIEFSHKNADGRTVKMLLDPGGVFGEESLIDGRPQTFTARTTARSWIMLLRREEYLKIYERHPELVRAFKDVLRRRRRILEQVNKGEVDLTNASWPDFNPESLKAKQIKPIKDRGPKKSSKSKSR